MNISIRRKLLWVFVGVLIVASVVVLGNYLITQHYEQHHYVTIRTKGPHPLTSTMTQQRYEAISQQAETMTQQGIDAVNQRRRMQKLNGQ